MAKPTGTFFSRSSLKGTKVTCSCVETRVLYNVSNELKDPDLEESSTYEPPWSVKVLGDGKHLILLTNIKANFSSNSAIRIIIFRLYIYYLSIPFHVMYHGWFFMLFIGLLSIFDPWFFHPETSVILFRFQCFTDLTAVMAYPRCWFQTFFIFTLKIREMIQFDEHIFQMGWNHQLVIYCPDC